MPTDSRLREATHANVQQIIPYISIGTGIDTTAADDIDTWTYNGLAMSNPAQVTDANYIPDVHMALYEGDGIPTALSNDLVAPPLAPAPAPPEIGLISDVISGADGSINWSFEIKLTRPHESAFTVYTGGQVNITSATFTFYNGAQTVKSVDIAGTGDKVQYKETTVYDRVKVNIHGIDKPFHHVRVSEVEFGASSSVSNAKLTGTISFISEADPLGLSVPMSELDFKLINVDGEFDTDNPNRAIDDYKIGTHVYFSLTIVTDSGQVTAPMGRYYIVSRDATPDALGITAEDTRAILQNTVRPIALKTTESIGVTLQHIFEDNNILFNVDDEVYGTYPVRDYRFSDKLDLLKQLLYIQQFYDIFSIPKRDGYLHLVKGLPTAEGDPITADTLMSFPKPSIAKGYNFISINYGEDGHYDLDLREEPDAAIIPLNIANPLVMTLAEAEAIAARIESRFYTQEYEAEAYGDPSLDILDNIQMEGRYKRGADADVYQVVKTELEYTGALTMRVKGVR